MNPNEPSPTLLKGQVALITGAGYGLGRALALAFAEAGAQVIIHDSSAPQLEETARLILSAGGEVRPYSGEINKGMAVRTLVGQVLDEFGQLDILVNQAHALPRAELLEMDEWEWQQALDINLTGPFLLMQTAGQIMRAQGSGVIINITPIDQPDEYAEEQSAAFAGKMGLLALSRAVVPEFLAYNIHTYAICTQEGLDSPDDEPDETAPHSPETIARFAVALCNPAGAPITGHVFLLKHQPISDKGREA